MMENSNFSCFKYFNFTEFKKRFLLNESEIKVYIYNIYISVDKKQIKLFKKVWMIQEQGIMISFST